MIRPNKRRFTIGFYLLSGFTTWGRQLSDPAKIGLSLCGGHGWIMCCGHVMRHPEVAAWIAEGLAIEGPADKYGRRTIIAGPKLEEWVSDAWHDMRVSRWGKRS